MRAHAKELVIRGRLEDSRHIELAEPVVELHGDVVVKLSPAEKQDAQQENIFDLIASLPPGTRTKEDIDAQIAEERASWGEP
jgi:hypothetical protein